MGLFTAITAYNYIVPAIDTPLDYIAKWDIRHYKDIRANTLLLFLIVTAWYSIAAMFKGFARRQRLHDTLMLPTRRTSRFVAEMIAALVVIPAILVAIWTTIDATDIIRHGFPSEYHSMEWFWTKDINFGFAMALIFSIHSLITMFLCYLVASKPQELALHWNLRICIFDAFGIGEIQHILSVYLWKFECVRR